MTESMSEEKNRTEMFKLILDFLKHLTTLSSGSILLILTLAEKFFKDSAFSPALFQSLGAFAVSILAALASMAVLSFSAGNSRFAGRSSYWFAWGFVTSAIGFVGGMFLIITAVFRQYG